MKKIVSVLLAGCMLLGYSSALAENTAATEAMPVAELQEAAQPTEYRLSIADAIAMATEGNTQLTVFEVQQKSAQLNLEVQRELKKAYKDLVINASNNMEVAYVKDGYYTEALLMQERLAVAGYGKQKNVIAYQVTEKYYQCKLAEQLVAVMEETLALVKENQKAMQAHYALGTISKLTLDNANIAVEQTELQKASYERTRDLAYDNLKIDLHLFGTEAVLILTDDITSAPFTSDVEKDIEAAMKTRYDVMALKETAQLSKLYFDITASHSAAEVAAYQSAYADYLSAQNTADTSTLQIALGVRSYYNAILTAQGELSIAEKTLSLKESEYEAAKLKHDMGMISNIELTTELNELSQQKIAVNNARATYRLAVEKYQYEIKTGL